MILRLKGFLTGKPEPVDPPCGVYHRKHPKRMEFPFRTGAMSGSAVFRWAGVCAWVLLSGVPGACGRDFFLTPEGAGARDGTGWENAVGAERMREVFNETMQAGDRLLLGGGTYSAAALVISRGGEAGRPREIAGVDRGGGLPVFLGDWSEERPAKGATAIRIAPGVSHVTVRGIRIRAYAFGVHAPADAGGAARSHLRFEDVAMERIRHGFFLADCDDVLLRNCGLRRYTKHGFRFERGCDRVRLERCAADCSEGDPAWETRTELFPFGFLLNDGGAPNTAFVFEDCVASNHLMPLQKTRYKNGDGFVVEANSTDVAFLRCRAIRNQDGGFDLKVREVRLTGCVAAGNSRGFRIWNTGTLDNCLAGWGAVGLWNNGGPVRASRCTFHELKDAAVLTDDAAVSEVTLADCVVTGAAVHRNTGRGTVVMPGTIIATRAGDAGYPKPDARWDGRGDAMDAAKYPGTGYRSSRGAETRSE